MRSLIKDSRGRGASGSSAQRRRRFAFEPLLIAATNVAPRGGNAPQANDQQTQRWFAEVIAKEIRSRLRPRECSMEFLVRQWMEECTYIRKMLTEYWTVRHDNAELTPSLKQLLSADMDFFKSIVHKETTLEQAWNPAQKDMIVDTLQIVQKQIEQASAQPEKTDTELARRLCHVLARVTLKKLAQAQKDRQIEDR